MRNRLPTGDGSRGGRWHDPDWRRAYHRAWRAAHPEYRERERLRRARARALARGEDPAAVGRGCGVTERVTVNGRQLTATIRHHLEAGRIVVILPPGVTVESGQDAVVRWVAGVPSHDIVWIAEKRVRADESGEVS